MNGSPHRLGFFLVTGSAVAWSLGGLFTRLIPLDSWTMVAWRGLFGAAGLAAVLLAAPQRGMWSSLKKMGRIGALAQEPI